MGHKLWVIVKFCWAVLSKSWQWDKNFKTENSTFKMHLYDFCFMWPISGWHMILLNLMAHNLWVFCYGFLIMRATKCIGIQIDWKVPFFLFLSVCFCNGFSLYLCLFLYFNLFASPSSLHSSLCSLTRPSSISLSLVFRAAEKEKRLLTWKMTFDVKIKSA